MKKKILIILLLLSIVLASVVFFFISGSESTQVKNEEELVQVDSDEMVTTGLEGIGTKVISSVVATTTTPAFQRVLSLSHKDTFAQFGCTLDNRNDTGFFWAIKYEHYADDNAGISLAKMAVLEWEPNIVKDIGNLIFSQITPSEREQLLTFRTHADDPEVRVADLLVDGKNVRLHYVWLSNYLVFASSLECVYALEP
jgi:hypothetical protein